MPTISTTKLTSDYMEEKGYWCQKVESWNPWAKKRKDLCACDVIALKQGEPPTLIQSTTNGNLTARVKKLNGTPEALLWLRVGGRILVHGWKPGPKRSGTYVLREVDWRGDE